MTRSTAPRRLASMLLALVGLASAAACGDDDGARPRTGALAVTVAGLPAGTDASITVTGPGAFSRAITATTTLAALVPGSYVVTASATGGGLAPYPPSQSVTVTAGGTAAVSVLYANVVLGLRRVTGAITDAVHLAAPRGDPRLFIVQQSGRIRVYEDAQLLPTPFLDISTRVRTSGSEEGLLGLAFDPDFATNGHFYVYFTTPTGDNTVERYTAPPQSDVAGSTPTPVITIPHPNATNHNGGMLMFGPDGMLYLAPGDGGAAGNAQDLGSLLGKVLRIDVRTLPYAIPSGNPFVGQAGRRPEIWAYGLRNPWRFDFDVAPGASVGALYIADVGETSWEEIDVAPAATAGIDYGWPVAEGTRCRQSGCSLAGLRPPVFEYDHSQGCSVTGGYVYRGTALPELAGQYFYSDYCGGWLASLTGSLATGYTSHRWPVPVVGNVRSFGEDGAGELYVLTTMGVYQIVGGNAR